MLREIDLEITKADMDAAFDLRSALTPHGGVKYNVCNHCAYAQAVMRQCGKVFVTVNELGEAVGLGVDQGFRLKPIDDAQEDIARRFIQRFDTTWTADPVTVRAVMWQMSPSAVALGA